MKKMTGESTILHLSDIQFGANHRFVGCTPIPTLEDISSFSNSRYINNEAFGTLATKIEDDLKVLYELKKLKPNILVISGDLAEWSMEDEYKKVEAFINFLIKSKYTDLTLQRVILVPGNHDINWSLSEAYFLECVAHRKQPEVPYEKKYFFWNQFLQRIYNRKLPEYQTWKGFDLSEFGILIIALDSSLQESHRNNDHYGWLGLSQIKEAMAWLENVDPSHNHAHLAVFHHNPIRYSSNDNENLSDWDEVRPHFEKNVDIILHGHRHENYKSVLGNLSGQKIVILGAGSAGLDNMTMPSTPNQFQIIKIKGQDGIIYLRSYTEQAFGVSGKGKFRADADEKGQWEYDFKLKSVSIVPEYRLSTGISFPTQDIPAIEEYVKFAFNEIKQRLFREQEKVGEVIRLQCVDIKTQEKTDLKNLFIDWLNLKQSRMVILGTAGSGKTISCLSFCLELSDNNATASWIPVYIDLGRFAAHDDVLEIFVECFRSQGFLITKQQALSIITNNRLLFFLDAFDEYEMGGIAAASDRPFNGFEHLNRPNIKILLTCRSNFFRSPEDIFIYELRTHEFEICPPNSTVVELLPLESSVVSTVLSQYIEADYMPEWIFELADRPLYLRMLVPLVRMKALDLSKSLKRHELYEKFITYILSWDLRRRTPAKVTLDQSRFFHVILAERFLEHGSASLVDVELLHLIEKAFFCKRTDDRFAELLFFFQQSGLLRFEGGRIVFSHKSYREYLVAKKIFDLITVGDDSFDFTWFTRNERDFINEMLSEPEKEILCRWLSNEQKYPACNYAIFILGGTGDTRIISYLMGRLNETNDPLVKINCANALAALGSRIVKSTLLGIIVGYLLDESIITIAPTGVEKASLEWTSKLVKKFGNSVMLIHLCETIDALAMVGDAACIDTLRHLERAPHKSVADEAKGAIRRLVNRLSEDSSIETNLPSRTRRSTRPKKEVL